MANSRLDSQALLALADTPWQGAPKNTRVGHVHLQVGDVATETRLYAGVVGMHVTASWDSAMFLSTGGYHLAVNSWASAGAGLRDPRRAGLASVTLGAVDDAVQAAIARRAAGPSLSDGGLREPWGTMLRIQRRAPGEPG